MAVCAAAAGTHRRRRRRQLGHSFLVLRERELGRSGHLEDEVTRLVEGERAELDGEHLPLDPGERRHLRPLAVADQRRRIDGGGGRDHQVDVIGRGAARRVGEARGRAEVREEVDHERTDRAGVGHVEEHVAHLEQQLGVELVAQPDRGEHAAARLAAGAEEFLQIHLHEREVAVAAARRVPLRARHAVGGDDQVEGVPASSGGGWVSGRARGRGRAAARARTRASPCRARGFAASAGSPS